MPATMFTESNRGGATAVVKNESLGVIGKILSDGSEKRIGKIAVFEEILAIFEVDEGDLRRNGGGFGFLGEGDESVVGFGEMIVGDERGGGSLKASDF